MINPRRQDQQIPLPHPDPNPPVPAIAHVEKPLSVEDIPNLLVLVQVFVEERPHLLLVHRAHRLRADGHLVAVLVRARRRERVELVEGVGAEELLVEDADALEVGEAYGLARVVVGALVALYRRVGKTVFISEEEEWG